MGVAVITIVGAGGYALNSRQSQDASAAANVEPRADSGVADGEPSRPDGGSSAIDNDDAPAGENVTSEPVPAVAEPVSGIAESDDSRAAAEEGAAATDDTPEDPSTNDPATDDPEDPSTNDPATDDTPEDPTGTESTDVSAGADGTDTSTSETAARPSTKPTLAMPAPVRTPA